MKIKIGGSVENGKVKLSAPLDVSFLEGKKIIVEVSEWKSSRSKNQNSYLWGVVYGEIADFTGMSPDEIHEGMKVKFLTDFSRSVPKVKSTKSLSTKEFSDFVEKVRLFAVENLGIRIPEPNEPPLDENGYMP